MKLWERARAAFKPRRTRDDFQWIYEQQQGKRALGWVFDACGMTQSTVRYKADGSVDCDATLIAEGRRQVGLMVQDMLNFDEDELRDLETYNAGQGE